MKDIISRAGLSQTADFLISPGTDILKICNPENVTISSKPGSAKTIHCILVDEAQFLVYSCPYLLSLLNSLRLGTDTNRSAEISNSYLERSCNLLRPPNRFPLQSLPGK